MRYFDMREVDDDGTRLVREAGWLPGLTAGLQWRCEGWQFVGTLAHHAGAIDYDGRTQTGVPLTSRTDTRHWDLDLRALREVDGVRDGAVGVGLSYHRWQRGIRGQPGVPGLDETYTAWSVFLEARATWATVGPATIGVDARWGRTLGPEVRVDFGGRYDDVTLQLGNRSVARLAMPITIPSGPGSRLVLDVAAQWGGYGRSATETLRRGGAPVGTVYQPRVTAHQVGLGATWSTSW